MHRTLPSVWGKRKSRRLWFCGKVRCVTTFSDSFSSASGPESVLLFSESERKVTSVCDISRSEEQEEDGRERRICGGERAD